MPSVHDLLKTARYPEATVAVCLRGDLQLRYNELTDRAHALSEDDARLSGPSAPLQAIRDEQAEVREEMQAATLTLTLRGLPRDAYNAIQAAAGAPRPGNPLDEQVGFHFADFTRTLIARCIVAAAAPGEPAEELDGADVEDLLGKLTDAQFDELWTAARDVNRVAPRPPTVPPISDGPPR